MDKECEEDLEIINAPIEGAEADLPPAGELIRSPPEVGSHVLVLGANLLKRALKATILAVKEGIIEGTIGYYEVKLDKQDKERRVSPKYLALETPANVLVPEGTRVIARYTDTSGDSDFFAGVVAEPAKKTNHKRYLVFFDDGSVQYVNHDDIFVVSKQSVDVADDIHENSRDFVRKYLERYPEYPMKKLTIGQCVNVECNSEWIDATVVEVDCSLAKLQYVRNPEEIEWIHRGSARLKSEQNSSVEAPNPVSSVLPSEIDTEPPLDVPPTSDEIITLESVPNPSPKDEGESDEAMDFDSIDIDFDE